MAAVSRRVGLQPVVCGHAIHAHFGSSCLPMIVVDYAAKHVPAFHRALLTAMLDWYWASLLDALVRTGSVVVADVFSHHTPQVTFA